jgi:hypothetical protein
VAMSPFLIFAILVTFLTLLELELDVVVAIAFSFLFG